MTINWELLNEDWHIESQAAYDDIEDLHPDAESYTLTNVYAGSLTPDSETYELADWSSNALSDPHALLTNAIAESDLADIVREAREHGAISVTLSAHWDAQYEHDYEPGEFFEVTVWEWSPRDAWG
jgi:hypothetical protein